MKLAGGIMLKIIRALNENAKKRDTKPTEKLLTNQIRLTIERLGDKYLKDADDILQFEATSKSALDATLDVLTSDKFREKYEFSQDSETLFSIRLRLLDILD